MWLYMRGYQKGINVENPDLFVFDWYNSCLRLTLPATERVVDFHHQVITHAGRT